MFLPRRPPPFPNSRRMGRRCCLSGVEFFELLLDNSHRGTSAEPGTRRETEPRGLEETPSVRIEFAPISRCIPRCCVNPQQLQRLVREYNTKLDCIPRQGAAMITPFNHDDSRTPLLLLPNVGSVGPSAIVRSQTPCDDDIYEHISIRCFRRIITPMVGIRLGGELACERASYKGRELYEWTLGNPELRSAAGWVFEDRAHGVLEAAREGRARLGASRSPPGYTVRGSNISPQILG